ncbi:excalibur calcium-binding domain-containing protein [Nocardioides pacificus]
MRIRATLAALCLLTAPLAVAATAAPAQAAPRFSSCDQLTRVFPNGVAKSKAAAQKQVRNGNSRPAFGKRAKAVYRTNKSNLDRDKDGTACEN